MSYTSAENDSTLLNRRIGRISREFHDDRSSRLRATFIRFGFLCLHLVDNPVTDRSTIVVIYFRRPKLLFGRRPGTVSFCTWQINRRRAVPTEANAKWRVRALVISVVINRITKLTFQTHCSAETLTTDTSRRSLNSYSSGVTTNTVACILT